MVIKSEDARLRGDLGSTRGYYGELHGVNNELIGEYVKRATNHQQLLGALKEVREGDERERREMGGEPRRRGGVENKL